MTGTTRCDACGKEVGEASLWRRMGFTPGTIVNQVCTSCHKGKLRREDRIRFVKGPLRRKAGASARVAEESPEERDPRQPPDELRF